MFTLPALPYDFNGLEPFIDEQTMKIHHDKHHQAYVDNLNKALEGNKDLLAMPVEEILSNMDKVPEAIKQKVRNHGGGHANHSLFWKIMAPNLDKTERRPQIELAAKIDSTFGSFESFQEQFAAAAMGRFGSGWAWLCVNYGELLIMDTPNQDSPLLEGRTPILGVDLWEHAYYLKYQNRRADYIDSWWNAVDWVRVGELFAEAKEK